mmetsp:Transcript_2445/g.6054  ORF Transcript_2445/g.6054 Transcript_2445/m.6054 type:complete len:112 (-) Transcript_2445:92-427(-)
MWCQIIFRRTNTNSSEQQSSHSSGLRRQRQNDCVQDRGVPSGSSMLRAKYLNPLEASCSSSSKTVQKGARDDREGVWFWSFRSKEKLFRLSDLILAKCASWVGVGIIFLFD